MRRIVPNLFIVGGDGRNSGKTAMICRILMQIREINIIPVKISPHFHEPSPGLNLIASEEDYRIYEETNPWSAKDTSRMLQCGVSRVFYSQALEERIGEVFTVIEKSVPAGTPIICESPGLIKYIDPGMFVIMRGSDNPAKDLSALEIFRHTDFTIEQLDNTPLLPFFFDKEGWKLKQ